MANAQLKHVMLHCLSEESLSGYGLMKRIQDSSGTWKPSFGSIYPRLKKMKEDGIVSSKKDGRRIIYSLSSKGKEMAAHQQDHIREAMHLIMAKARMFHSIDKEMVDLHGEVLDQFLEGKDPLKEISQEALALKKVLFTLHREGRLKTKKNAINSILKRATKQLQELQ